MPIPEWKWERIAMDFVIGLPKTMSKYDSILVIVDRLTKSAHFIVTTCLVVLSSRFYFWKNRLRRWNP